MNLNRARSGSGLARLAGGVSGGAHAVGALSRLGGLGAGAVKADGVDAERARVLGLGGLRGVDNSDVGGTTALGVLDNGTGGLASRSVLAGRSIGHRVVEL